MTETRDRPARQGRRASVFDEADRRVVATLLRDLRRAAGFRSVRKAAGHPRCDFALQTIYAWERTRVTGRSPALTPSLERFLQLVRFYVIVAPQGPSPKDAKALTIEELRVKGVEAVTRALSLSSYHVVDAQRLIEEMSS